jgi:hypothetical protein
MSDLTGYPIYRDLIIEDRVQKKIKNGKLFTEYLGDYKAGYMISVTTPGEDNLTSKKSKLAANGKTGIIAGHCYAVMNVWEEELTND